MILTWLKDQNSLKEDSFERELVEAFSASFSVHKTGIDPLFVNNGQKIFKRKKIIWDKASF